MATPFSKKCDILAELWIGFRDDDDFKDFIKYNDVSLPLAYFLSTGIVENPTLKGEGFIDETWDLMEQALELDPDAEWDNLIEILESIKDKD
jgi:hypothetical protein